MFLQASVRRFLRRPTRSFGVAAFSLKFLVAAHRTAAQVPGELRGRITDATTGRAIAGARIEIADRVEPARSDADGAFVVRGLEPKTYGVAVRAVGYAAFKRDVSIQNGRTALLDAVLDPVPIPLAAVVSSAPRPASERETAAFDRAAIESSGKRDVGELLTTVPGVVVTRSGGPGQPTQVSIRGSSAAEVLVVVDGVVANSPLTGVADLSQLSLATIERVTVWEGAQSARYGGRALAGVVVVDTRRAEREGSLSLDAGSWGARAVSGSIGDATESASRLSGMISAEHRTTRGDFSYDVPAVRGGGTALRANSDATSTSVLGVAGIDGSGGSVRLRGDWRSTDRGLAGSIVQPSLTGRDDEHHASAALELSSTRGVFVFDGSASLARDRTHFSDPRPPFGSSYDDVLDATEARAASLATASGSLGAATPASLTLGGDARELDVTATSLASNAPRSQRIVGAYTSVRLSRELGVVGVATTFAGRVDHDDLIATTVSSPRASVELSRGAASLSASIGNGYSPPSLADQFFHEGVLVKANPSLAPERTRGETELRAAVRDVTFGVATLSGDASVYRADVDGMILWSPDFRFIWSPLNVDVRRSGWQLGARFGVPAAWGGGFNAGANVDRSDVTYTGAGQNGQVIYRPRTTARISESIARRYARVDVETRYVGSRRTVAGTDLNGLDPYWLTDVRLAVPVVRAAWRLEGTVGVENVFDRPASMLVDYPFGGRRWTVGFRTSRRAGGAGEGG
jgi:outer membrane cobalamin receptor